MPSTVASRRMACLLLASASMALLPAGGWGATSRDPLFSGARPLASKTLPHPALLVPTVRHVTPAGPIPPTRHFDERSYLAAKAWANDRSALASHGDVVAARQSGNNVSYSFQGVDDGTVAPSDSTSAVGPTRFIEVVNRQYGIYDKSGNKQSDGSLGDLSADGTQVSDPQILWDPTTARFYYVIQNFGSNKLDWGFSKTDTPTSASNDFCHYIDDVESGQAQPDYPQLGDTLHNIVIGVNAIPSGAVSHADVVWINKPTGAVDPCPPGANFTTTIVQNLVDAQGHPAATPQPAREIDGRSTGWVVAAADVSCAGCTASYLSAYQMAEAQDGTLTLFPAISVPVLTYSIPPSAPQPGAARNLDTQDGRLTNAFLAFDPRFSRQALWTQHTVASSDGSTSDIHWYELDPETQTVLQYGVVHDSQLFIYNGAIAPDRLVNGSVRGFGQDMALGFNTSSATQKITIQMVTKLAGQVVSSFQTIVQSPDVDQDLQCDPPRNCDRWGDYSGASPDPSTAGRTWFTNAWVSRRVIGKDWRTWNWAVTLPTSSWPTTPSSNQGSSDNYLYGVSCVTSRSCVAVGNYGYGLSAQTLVETWDGKRWSIVPSPNQPSSGSNLLGVSCVSLISCMAVGTNNHNGIGSTLVEKWDGLAWSIIPSPNPGAFDQGLSGVSCISPARCVAVGHYLQGTAYRTLVETWDGSRWSVVGSPNQGSSGSNLVGVSCTASTSCVAVGYHGNGSSDQTLVETWDGRRWVVTTSPNQGGDLGGVSCIISTSCVAVGGYFNGTVAQTVVETWDGIRWSVTASPNQGASGSSLDTVSCATPTSCVAVGSYYNGSVDQTLVETLFQTSWAINPSSNRGSSNNLLLGISCATPTTCAAVGWYGSATVQTLTIQGRPQ